MASISIDTGSGRMNAYLAAPGVPAPAIVLIQEIFGINPGIRALADGLAANGFLVACPDLFWRMEPGVQLSDGDPQAMAKAFDLYSRFDVAKGVADIQSTISTLRGRKDCTGRVGGVGYCLGGLLAYLAARITDVDCSVGYYGVGIDQALAVAGDFRAPLMLHIAQADEHVPREAQHAIHEAYDAAKMVTLHDYSAAGHAFARRGGANFLPDAAELADRRTLQFLTEHLSPRIEAV
jgi:carboxymethylenebutenolidase